MNIVIVVSTAQLEQWLVNRCCITCGGFDSHCLFFNAPVTQENILVVTTYITIFEIMVTGWLFHALEYLGNNTMAEQGMAVELYIYDLTNGLASILSPSILGK